MLAENEKIELIARSILDINKVKDLDLLLEKILRNAREFFNADAGSIYLKEGDELKFTFTQNKTLQRRLDPGKKLIYNTFSIPINDQSIAGYVAKNKETVNIPDVYQISDQDPYTFDSNFDVISDYLTRSMLTVPMTTQYGFVLGVMQLINAQDDKRGIVPFSQDDESLIMNFVTGAALALDRAQLTRHIVLRMISMAELRDPMETSAHVKRVADYSVEIYEDWARERKRPEDVERKKDILRPAAMLHDVGKIAISDTILKKPARLTVAEFEIIKSHTTEGARLFKEFLLEFDEMAHEIVLNHHEKWDGTGYPARLKGEHIPEFGRIVAIADVYDALSSRRSYKEPWEEDRVLEEMRQQSGKHFDPDMISSFFNCLDILKSIARRYPDEEE